MSPGAHRRSCRGPRTSDAYGNVCDRLTLPPGRTVLRYDAHVDVSGPLRRGRPQSARQVPVELLPDETMVFLLPSRFCLSDVLRDQAWELFGATEPGWARVVAVCDWAHDNVQFQLGSSNPLTSALDVWQSRHRRLPRLRSPGLTLCRSLNIPARYVFGYLPDVGVPPPDEPMDFCAWFEAYLEDRWWTFDPRNNVPRAGRVVIGRGRDALDVAMVTTYGAPVLAVDDRVGRPDRRALTGREDPVRFEACAVDLWGAGRSGTSSAPWRSARAGLAVAPNRGRGQVLDADFDVGPVPAGFGLAVTSMN